MFNFLKTKYKIEGYRGLWVIATDFGNDYFNMENTVTGAIIRHVPLEALIKQ